MESKWKYKFEEMGGYDCMSDSYDIYDEEGEMICEVDVATFNKVDKVEANKEAERIAKLIVDSVNAQSRRKGSHK